MTDLTTSFTAQLLTGFARLLAEGTGWAWREDGSDYLPTEVGIGIDDYPTLCGDQAVALGDYPLTANPTLSDSTIGIQFRSRAGEDPFAVRALDDAVQNAFLGRFPITLPTGIRVWSLIWASGSTLGFDATTRRRERVSNFRCGVARHTTYR